MGLIGRGNKSPYDQSHTIRLAGSITALILTVSSLVVTTFYYTADENVATKGRIGVLLVRLVDKWISTWFQAKTIICGYADGKSLSIYQWHKLYEETYGTINKTDACNAVFKLMLLSTISEVTLTVACIFFKCPSAVQCWAIPFVSAIGGLFLTVYSRKLGNPEIIGRRYFDHCRTAMFITGLCIAGIALPPLVFTFMSKDSDLFKTVTLRYREGVFVAVVGAVALGLVIFGYHIDRNILTRKFEFENLVWAPAVDPQEIYRQQVRHDIERLEQAKFGGLQTPTEIARLVVDSDDLHGVDRETVRNIGAWM